MASAPQLETPAFDRIRKGDGIATEDAIRILWFLANDEITKRPQTRMATNAVTGPASATNNAIVRFDTTSGKLIKNSGLTIDDPTAPNPNTINIPAGAPATNWHVAAFANGAFGAWNDSTGTPGVYFTPSGDVTAAGKLFERNRTTAMGEWIDVAANNSYFAMGGAGAGNWNAGTVITYAYTLVGKTLTLSVATSGGTWTIASNQVNLQIPNGYTAARTHHGVAFCTNAAMGWELCYAQVIAGQGWVTVFRNGLVNFPAGGSVVFNLQIAVSIQ